MTKHIGMDDDEETIAKVFCFGAFVDKTSGIVYNDLTGSFPFVSLDKSVCFFVLYYQGKLLEYLALGFLATPRQLSQLIHSKSS